MNLNNWTVGLAMVGAVSLAPAVSAEEKASALQTAFSSTTFGGYVDTSAQWNFGTGNANLPPYKFGGSGKADGFNLEVVQLTFEKPLDEKLWSTGYRVDLWYGPDANTLGTQTTRLATDLAIRQAYVHLQVPIGNGLTWKIGVFDSILGYESVESGSNPNYTRSYGHSIEPQTHTGILGKYKFSEYFSASVGVANTVNSAINSRATSGALGNALLGESAGSNAYGESYKAYMASVQFIAPDTCGLLSGSGFYMGVVNGYNNSVLGTGGGFPTMNTYVGTTLTPIQNLRVGLAWDRLDANTSVNTTKVNADAWSLAGYLSYQATTRLSAHLRVDYVTTDVEKPASSIHNGIFATTATLQYDLWQNVISRLEFRWDAADHGNLFGGTTGAPTRQNAFLLAANVIYKF
jgi:hypothetical protein